MWVKKSQGYDGNSVGQSPSEPGAKSGTRVLVDDCNKAGGGSVVWLHRDSLLGLLGSLQSPLISSTKRFKIGTW